MLLREEGEGRVDTLGGKGGYGCYLGRRGEGRFGTWRGRVHEDGVGGREERYWCVKVGGSEGRGVYGEWERGVLV